MVLILDIWAEGLLGELGINGAFLLGYDLDLTAEVDAEHTLNGHDHVDRATCAPLYQTYATLHTVGVLVWRSVLLGHNDAANEFETRIEMHLRLKWTYTMFLCFMSLMLETEVAKMW